MIAGEAKEHGVRQDWEPEDLIEVWTLLEEAQGVGEAVVFGAAAEEVRPYRDDDA